LRIFHWNIAGGKENGCKPGPISEAVLKFVKDHKVDFVGLNEVCPKQHDAIEKALRAEWKVPNGTQFAAYKGDELATVVGNSIFARLGFVPDSIEREELGADQYGKRFLICAKILGFPHLRQCATHLSPNDDKAGNQLVKMLGVIEKYWEKQNDTVFFTGDLNLRADAKALDIVYSATVNTKNNSNNKGQYREVDDNDPQHCLGYGERTLPNTTGGPCKQGGKIDFIFIRQNHIVAGDYDGDTFNIPKTCNGKVCSDHRPVFGRARVQIALD